MSSDLACVNTSVDRATDIENSIDDNLTTNCCKDILHDLGIPTSTKQAQSSVQFDSYAEHIEDLKTGQMINNETIRSLAESVEQIASAVAEIQSNARTEA